MSLTPTPGEAKKRVVRPRSPARTLRLPGLALLLRTRPRAGQPDRQTES